MKKALITGITGQDGSYLAEILLGHGYEVHGIIRRSSSFNTQRIMHLFRDFHQKDVHLFLHYGDLADASTLSSLITRIAPDEIYNMAAQSHVRVSFDIPEYTADIVSLGALRLLEALRMSNMSCRFYQASSSEMFGSAPPPQNESTPFQPCSPYAIAKLDAHWMTISYRKAYGLHASTGILFNHESPRRGETFVTRKITMAIPKLLLKEQDFLYLGNLQARRDWGHARDYMEAVYAMLQCHEPDDYVIGTGESHSVEEFVAEAFGLVGMEWQRYVRIDPRYFRPNEIDTLCADATYAEQKLNWRSHVSFKELVREMVENELKLKGLTFEQARDLALKANQS